MVHAIKGKERCLMKAYTYDDNVFTFEGSISVQREKDWVMPWRIDFEHYDFYPFLTDSVAKECSGVRLAFASDTQKLSLELAEANEGQTLDLFVNDSFAQRVVLQEQSLEVQFQALQAGLKNIEIWLDPAFSFKLKSIKIDDTARISKIINTKKRWVHYGSSISHCKLTNDSIDEGRAPSKIWPALVAQKMNLHLTNLGFSGNCKLKPMIARIIRDLKADYITLKLGINLHAEGLTERTFAAGVIGFIQIIREKHPHTPIALISPIYSPPREETKGEKSGLSLQDMRKIHQRVVEICKKYGDTNIYYVDGLKIFGEAELNYMPDQLHPNAKGQPVLAENFIREVFYRLPCQV